MTTTKKKILITGAAGFIGFSLANYFLKKNYNVYGIDNFDQYYSVKLKKYFIDKKFTDKNTWLLAINETNEILWIPTLEISERVKVKNSSTHCFQIL